MQDRKKTQMCITDFWRSEEHTSELQSPTHISYMEFRKMAMTTLYARQEKDTDVYNGLLDSEGEGEGGMICENGILTCIISCKN